MIDLQLWKERKKALKLSLQDIANETGISISTIKDIFRGATAAPRIDTVLAIKMVLGLNVNHSPITDNLKKFRTNAGISRAKMAQILDIPQITYLSIECGFLDITPEMLKIICATLSISEKDILGRTVEEMQDITINAVKQNALRDIGYIDFILSADDKWEKYDYYVNLSNKERETFVFYLFCTTEELQEEKERLQSMAQTIDKEWLIGAYQRRPELWEKRKTENDDENR